MGWDKGKERHRQKAMMRAYRSLASKHPEEFLTIYNQERANLGLPPNESRSRSEQKVSHD